MHQPVARAVLAAADGHAEIAINLALQVDQKLGAHVLAGVGDVALGAFQNCPGPIRLCHQFRLAGRAENFDQFSHQSVPVE